MKWQASDAMPIAEDVLVRLKDGRVFVGWLQGNGRVFVQDSVQSFDQGSVAGWLPLNVVPQVFDLLASLHKALEFARIRTKPAYAYEWLFGKKSNPRKHAALIDLDEIVAKEEE